jgi:mannose-1-phosphate guanylyltransferase/mannose-6-phosphate isomerase
MPKPTRPQTLIHPVVLSGGAGTRLWPLSRRLFPKQLLALAGEESLLQQTALRVADASAFAPPVVVCNEDHRFTVAEQLRQVGATPAAMILEPEGRNTAPAVALAALHLADADPAALILVLPSDHVIAKPKAFAAMVKKGRRAAEREHLVTFGITPSRPDTNYGYIKRGGALKGVASAGAVEKFVEKPDRTTATLYHASGEYLWNAGMFLFRADTFLAELDRLQPDILAACRMAMASAVVDLDFCRPDRKAFSASPSLSIDYAVMEETTRAAVVPADIGWSDLGGWPALWDLAKRDKAGNAAVGDVITEDVENSYLHADHGMIAAVGLEDMVVVSTDDVVFVAPMARAAEAKTIVARLRDTDHDTADSHSTVYRPWGSYQNIDEGARFKVKRITVRPGGILSLQRHRKRAEHWVVVSGTARVTRGIDLYSCRRDSPVGESRQEAVAPDRGADRQRAARKRHRTAGRYLWAVLSLA